MAKIADWIIVQDYISPSTGELPQFNPETGKVTGLHTYPYNKVSIFGPRTAEKPDYNKLPLAFLIADDDGNVYYIGRANERAEFQPLDMYGEPNDGATTIAYRDDLKPGGLWRVL